MKDQNSDGDFSARIGNWVVWNVRPWDRGWITLVCTSARSKPGVKRKAYRVDWNGTRFARCKQGVKLEEADPDLADNLRLVIPAGSHLTLVSSR